MPPLAITGSPVVRLASWVMVCSFSIFDLAPVVALAGHTEVRADGGDHSIPEGHFYPFQLPVRVLAGKNEPACDQNLSWAYRAAPLVDVWCLASSARPAC
jgi:hypothetical protein